MTFDLTEQQFTYTMQVLAQRPWAEANEIICSMQQQAQAQAQQQQQHDARALRPVNAT
jgi:hypothetical protein